MKKYSYLLLVALLLMFSCKEKKTWDNARVENSIKSYENYLKEYPKGKFADSAAFYIEGFKWDFFSKGNSIDSYEEYLKNYPEGRYVDSANKKIEYIKWLEAASIASKDNKVVILATGTAKGTLSVLPFGRSKLLTIFNPKILNGNTVELSYKLENEFKDKLVLVASFTEANIAALTSSFYYRESGYVMSEKTIKFSPRPGSWVNGKTKVRIYFLTMEDLNADNERSKAVSNVVTIYLNY